VKTEADGETLDETFDKTLELISALTATEERIQLNAIEKLASHLDAPFDKRVLDAVVQCLGSRRKAIQRRVADVLAAAAPDDSRVYSALREALESPDFRLRWGAAFTFGKTPHGLDLHACPVLLEALSSSDGDLRWAAAELLVKLGRVFPSEVRVELLGVEQTGNAAARKMALYCLRDLNVGGEEIQSLISRACRSAEPHVRLAALSLLGRLGNASDESADVALQMLESDSDHGVRRAAASALGRLGYPSSGVCAALARAASDPNDGSLRKAAQQALAQLEQS
jgi:HEAT repeat protein